MQILREGVCRHFRAQGFENGLLNILYPRGLDTTMIMASIGGTLKIVADARQVMPDFATSCVFRVERAALLYWTRGGDPEWRIEWHETAPEPGSFVTPTAIRLEGHVVAISQGVTENPTPLSKPVPMRACAEVYGADIDREDRHLIGKCVMARFQTVPPQPVPGRPNAMANADHPWNISP